MNDNKLADSESRERKDPTAGRRIAEWTSLCASALLILCLAGMLAYEGLQGHSPIVPVEIEPLWKAVAVRNEKYVLPVNITNRGRRTLRELTLRLTAPSASTSTTPLDIQVDYLGTASHRIVYFYLAAPPNDDVRIEALGYQLD